MNHEMIGKWVKIEFEVETDRVFNYRGILLSEDEHFLVIDDRKDGKKSLNKRFVKSITEESENH